MFLSISRNSLQTPSLDDILLENFILSNLVILVEDVLRWKRGLKYSQLTTMLMKMSLVSIKKFLYQCHPPYTMQVNSHRVLYMLFLGAYNICIIYLHVIGAARLKVTIAMFYFYHSKKSFTYFEKYLFPSLYILEKNVLVNRCKKQICYKENKSLFLISWKMAKFFLQKFVIFNMITDYFLVEKWETLKHVKRYVWKNSLNLE